MASKTLPCASQSTKLGPLTRWRRMPRSGSLSHTVTSRSGSGNGNGLRNTARMTANMVVLPPMPSAMVATISAANPGLRTIARIATRRSIPSFVVFYLCS